MSNSCFICFGESVICHNFCIHVLANSVSFLQYVSPNFIIFVNFCYFMTVDCLSVIKLACNEILLILDLGQVQGGPGDGCKF